VVTVEKKCILISGPNIAQDEELSNRLDENFKVIKNSNNQKIYDILIRKQVDMVLLEIQKDLNEDLNIVKSINDIMKNLPILLINGNGDKFSLAKAFEAGVRDAFRKPYKINLIVERVISLLNLKGNRHSRQ
jgi:PleD family two-component response regulator